MRIGREIGGRSIFVEIVRTDITKVKADAIVNAAHEALLGGGGVDGAIHRAAGSSLLSACREIKEVEPGVRCRVGEAHLTIGGNLPAKYVIHTVAPVFVGTAREPTSVDEIGLSRWSLTKRIYDNAKPGTEEDLANCYKSVIEVASQYGIKSLAFSSLGTGGHAWPIEIACPIAIEATEKALEKAPEIERVIFICFSQNDMDVYVNGLIERMKDGQ